MKNFFFSFLFFLFFLFFFLPSSSVKGENNGNTILVGGINLKKDSRYRRIIEKWDKEEIERRIKSLPQQLEIYLVGTPTIPAVLIVGREAPPETSIVIGLRNQKREVVLLPLNTKIWFCFIEIIEGKEIIVEDIIIAGFSFENPYRVKEPVSSVSFKGEEIIKFVGGMDPEDFLKKFYLKICVSINF